MSTWGNVCRRSSSESRKEEEEEEEEPMTLDKVFLVMDEEDEETEEEDEEEEEKEKKKKKKRRGWGPLPRVLQGNFKVVSADVSSTAPCNPNRPWEQQLVRVIASKEMVKLNCKLHVGIVFLGEQEIGSQNIICGIMDSIKTKAGIKIYVFGVDGLDGLDGLCSGKGIKLDKFWRHFMLKCTLQCRNKDYIRRAKIWITPEEFEQAAESVAEQELDALVVIGGAQANSIASLLAEYFRSMKVKTRIIGCLNKCDLKMKTIDGDMDCNQVIGFDAACEMYVEQIENLMMEALSTGCCYYFVRVSGPAVSHLTLSCALQTLPTIAFTGDEVIAEKLTLKNIRDHIVDVICKRSELGYDCGLVLVPDNLFDIIPEVEKLIAELMEMWGKGEDRLGYGDWDEADEWKQNLSKQSKELFDLLPLASQELVISQSDPNESFSRGKVEIALLLTQLVEIELEKKKEEGFFKGEFISQLHFLGHSQATKFDCKYCYALGHAAAALVLNSNSTGLMTSLGNLDAPIEEWTVGGISLTYACGR